MRRRRAPVGEVQGIDEGSDGGHEQINKHPYADLSPSYRAECEMHVRTTGRLLRPPHRTSSNGVQVRGWMAEILGVLASVNRLQR